MQINVMYDRLTHLAAIGPSVWAKLGPEDWFDNFTIVAANSRSYVAPFVQDLGMQADDLEKFTTQNIVESGAFRSVYDALPSDYKFIVYRPLEPIAGISSDRFVVNDITFSRYEDKKIFRDTFAGKIPIPRYISEPVDDLLGGDVTTHYQRFVDAVGEPFVLQDNVNGGGRGTFIVDSVEKLEQSRNVLRGEHKGTYIVVSEFVPGIERSIQVFVSSDATIRGPLQQQLVRNEELVDPYGRGGMYFCGGRFLDSWTQDMESQLQTIVTTAGDVLRASGYRGIFGMDFLVDTTGKVWVIEINARTTGLLPLLNEQTTSVPLYLLHILELAELPYRITGEASYPVTTGPRSFVVLFNQTGRTAHFNHAVTTGNYVWRDGVPMQLDCRARWNPEADFMLQLFADEHFPSKPNLKLTNIFLRENGFDDTGNLLDGTRRVVDWLKQNTV